MFPQFCFLVVFETKSYFFKKKKEKKWLEKVGEVPYNSGVVRNVVAEAWHRSRDKIVSFKMM